MRVLRLLLVICLVLGVPTTALANVVAHGKCRDAQGQMPAAPGDHAGHAMPDGLTMDHASAAGHPSHDAHAAHTQKAGQAGDHCDCGCDCTGSHHCTAGGTGFVDRGPADGIRVPGSTTPGSTAVVQHVSTAHHLELLRPPTRA